MKQAKRTINRMYWIMHPAVTVNALLETSRYSPEQIKIFIETVVHPIVRKAQAEPDSAVVFVKTLPRYEPDKLQALAEELPQFADLYLTIKSRVERVSVIEDALEKFIRRMIKDRAIIRTEGLASEVAKGVEAEIKRKGFKIAKNADIEAYGSYWEHCSRDFPNKFRQKMKLTGKFRVPGTGSISMRRRFRRF